MTPTTGLVALARWLEQLKYNDIRRAESFQSVTFQDGKKRKQLRGVMVADDLCLSRNRLFYKILDDKAVVMPLSLVAEQYNVEALISGYRTAKREQRKQRAS